MSISGRWRHLCADFFMHTDASVVCKQLAYATGISMEDSHYTSTCKKNGGILKQSVLAQIEAHRT